MPSDLEESICSRLRAVLEPLPVGGAIPDTEAFHWILGGLEAYVSLVLDEMHGEWGDESLDGIMSYQARKIGPDAAVIVGVCILITDLTTTPIHIQMQMAPDRDEVSWFECRLGESVGGAMKRTPYAAGWSAKQSLDIADHMDSINWSYAVGFGHKRA